MKKINSIELRNSNGSLGGTPYDLIVNGCWVGTCAAVDNDDLCSYPIEILIKKGYEIPDIYELMEMLDLDMEDDFNGIY